MPTVTVLPLRLYRPAIEALSTPAKKFYQQVANLLVPGANGDQPSFITPNVIIPIDHDTALNSQRVARRLLATTDTWDKVDIVLVDLATPKIERLPDHHVVGGLLKAVDTVRTSRPSVTFILLMNFVLEPEDITMRAMKPYIASGTISILADDGIVCGSDVSPWNHDQYARLLRDYRDSPLRGIEMKLVRRVGHFKRRDREGLHFECLPYFFDGTYCQRELIEILEGEHQRVSSDPNVPLLYHGVQSQWIAQAALTYAQRSNRRIIDIERLFAASNIDSPVIPETSLLFLPLVDSFRTLESILDRLIGLNSGSTPTVLAVIATSSAISRLTVSGTDKYFSHRGALISFKYLIASERKATNPADCDACAANVMEDSTSGEDLFPQLSSYAMWRMIFDAGMRTAEVDAPDYRDPLGSVPNFRTVAERNGPYLASRIDRLIRTLEGGLPPHPVLLFPLEEGAIALADGMTSLFDYTAVGVPRPVLKLGPDRLMALIATSEGRDAPWNVKLTSLRDVDGIGLVLLDEFNRTGRTRSQLTAFAKSFALPIHCYACLVDFLPTQPWSSGRPELSLYDLCVPLVYHVNTQRLSPRGEAPEIACEMIGKAHRRVSAARDLSEVDKNGYLKYLRLDFATKSGQLAPSIEKQLWSGLMKDLIPAEVLARIGDDARLQTNANSANGSPFDTATSGKFKADAVVLAVFSAEFEATCRVFGINPAEEPQHQNNGGMKFYRTVIKQVSTNRQLVVYVTMVGIQRNAHCVNACRDIFQEFDPDVCLLVGIAGGNKEKVLLGDVVAASEIIDIEGGRAGVWPFPLGFISSDQPRIEPVSAPQHMRTILGYMNPSDRGLHRNYTMLLDTYKASPIPIKMSWWRIFGRVDDYRTNDSTRINKHAWKKNPKFYNDGKIICGEKVLANGAVPKYSHIHSDKIYAVDMEGSGFGLACNRCDVPWLVFRGIADYGDRRKAKLWHVPATVAAATAAKLFLEFEHRDRLSEVIY